MKRLCYASETYKIREMDDRNLDAATLDVLAEDGWDGLTLERVAERAGISRVTLWRAGETRESLIDRLLVRLSEDYRRAMWPVLAASVSGRERLALALEALCDVVDAHLPLLLISDTVFHMASAAGHPPVGFLDPFVRAVSDGAADGTLRAMARSDDSADVLFNTACWPYVHMRGRHKWSKARARSLIVGLVLEGATAPQ